MSKFTVSILTYSALDHAKRAIQAVLSGGGDFTIILTANGNPEVARYFSSLASKDNRFRVIINEKNQGFWKPNNAAFELCESEYFVMLNDDTVVPPGWLDVLVKPLEADEKGAISGPDNGCCSLQDSFHGFRGPRREYVEGSCMMVKASVAKKHGLFEPMPGLAYGEDSQISLRYKELGYTLHWVPLKVPHVRAVTSRKIPEVRKWQAANHEWLRHRFATYLANRKMNDLKNIVIRRMNALGDVLLVTPVIRALKERNPALNIYVETMHTDLFHNNKDVYQAVRRANVRDAWVVNLDGSYEAQPDRHFVHTYAARFGLTLKSTKTYFYPSGGDREWAERTVKGNWIAVHPGPSTWKTKDWGKPKFAELIKRIKESGYDVVLVGSKDTDSLGQSLDLRGKANYQQTGAILARCRAFVGIDSFPMHLSQAMGCPTVGLFGVTLPQYIMTDGSPAKAVCSDPNHPASGLRHKQQNKTSVSHASNPMDTISVDEVWTAIKELLEETKERAA